MAGTGARARGGTTGLVAAITGSLLLLLATTARGAERQVETAYVAELRAAVAQVEASRAEITALRAAGPGGGLWLLSETTPNPAGDPAPDGTTVSAGDGHLDRSIDGDPTVAFTTDWPPPPPILRPGAEHEIDVAVAGRITGGTMTQGFRVHDAILLVNDRWDGRTATGVGQRCVDPIGAAPISCSEPASGSGTFTVRVPSFVSESFSFGIGALNCGACYVRYTYAGGRREELAGGAGTRFLAAARRARAVLRTYRRADMRHGTAEERRLVQRMMQSLRATAAAYGGLTGVPVRVTPRKLKVAERLVRALADEAAEAAVERWPGIAEIAALLEDPRRAERIVATQIERRLTAEIRERSRAIARQVVRERLPFQLDVPIRAQVRNRVEQIALRRLTRGLLKLDKRGLLVQFFSRQVRIAIADIAQAARPTAKVERRTDITIAGYARRQARLDALLGNPNEKLPVVYDALLDAQGALKAARFLRRDLRDLVKRRCQDPTTVRCTGAQTTLARLRRADADIARRIAATRTTFLIGREFDPADLDRWIAGLGRLERDVRRARSRAR